jgi:ribose 5-phosphate isomerase RpiB
VRGNNVRIAVVNEVSAAEKNKDIMTALSAFDHEVVNVGMKKGSDSPELTYVETGFLAALLLNAGSVDLVVGGCGTGQGFLSSAMQYPNVFAGLIEGPLDAWLFCQINGGNCISLALNKGYGWAGDVNLRFIFERLFSVQLGCGYPEHRKESQRQSRERLKGISRAVHLPFDRIIESIEPEVLQKVLQFPGVVASLQIDHISNAALRDALVHRCLSLKVPL